MSTPLALALAGTAHHPGVTPVTGTELDPAIAAKATEAPERAILLAAGVNAVARLAGRPADSADSARTASRAESLPLLSAENSALVATLMAGVCPPELGSLFPEAALTPGESPPPEIADESIRSLLLTASRHGVQREDLEVDDDTIRSLLPETFALIAKAGQRLPPAMLPTVLDLKGAEVRAVLPAVLGERGRWLAGQNPAWAWVRNQEAAAMRQELPADAERLWQEGVLSERTAVLERLREHDPNQGLLWLTQTWKSEKADTRLTLMRALTVGLSLADEPFLEAALDDRSERVRAVAGEMLALLPDSGLAGRMQARALSCVTPIKKTKLLSARLSLEINPPEELPDDWRRDGILIKPTYASQGPRAWWLLQVVSRVLPAFWGQQLDASAEAFIAAAKKSEWDSALLQGWIQAAITFRDTEWLQAIHKSKPLYDTDILKAMPSAAAEQCILELLGKEKPQKGHEDEELVDIIPRPWNEQFSLAILPVLHRLGETNLSRMGDMLTVASTSLHPACLALALEPWDIPELRTEPANAKDYRTINIQEWGRRTLGQFLAVIALRRMLRQVFAS